VNQPHLAIRSCRDEACAAAFHEHFDFIYRALRRHGVLPADLEDQVQEVFLVVWQRWETYDPSRPLRPWLAGIAFRVARNQTRRRWREVPDGGLDPADVAPQGEEQLARARARVLVLTALSRLPPRHRDTLVLHDLDGLSAQEIGELTSSPVATVYTRVHRARRAFAQMVDQLRPRDQRGSALAPAALLALEKAAPPAPLQVRLRAEQWFRARLDVPGGPPPMPILAPRPFPLIAVGASLAIVTLVTVWATRPARKLPAIRPAQLATAPIERARSPRLSDPGARLSRPPALPTATAVRSTAALAQGLLGWWRLDDGPGSLVAGDSSGHGRPCQIHDLTAPAAWVDGVRGRALELGGHAWLECPQPETAAGRPLEITIAAWVRRASPTIPAAIATRQIGTGFHDQYFFGFAGDGLRVVSHAWSGWAVEAAPPPPGRWFHSTFTRDREGTTRLFVDGQEVAVSAGAPLDVHAVTGPLTLGAGLFSVRPDRVRQRFDGALDEVLVYARALSAGEIAALAAGAQPATTR
jgi:RNA polymerase sigma factor (sigma-70 family)